MAIPRNLLARIAALILLSPAFARAGTELPLPVSVPNGLPAQEQAALHARRAALLERGAKLQGEIDNQRNQCGRVEMDDAAKVKSCNDWSRRILKEYADYSKRVKEFKDSIPSAAPSQPPTGAGEASSTVKKWKSPSTQEIDASIDAQREYVKKKVKYYGPYCDPTGTSDMGTGVDCSCLMLKGNPQYFKKADGNFMRSAKEQYKLMVTRGHDSLGAKELKRGDYLYLRNPKHNPEVLIAHTSRVTDVLDCNQCPPCSQGNGDVCLKILEAPHRGTTVREKNRTLHKDKAPDGKDEYCFYRKNGSKDQCLVGGGRIP